MRRWLILTAVLMMVLPVRSQVVMEEIGALQESFSAAQQAFDSFQFPRALDSLNPLISTLSKWEQAGRLQPTDEALLEKALELRGVCEYNLGKLDTARQDFTRLVQLRPEYPFSVTKAPKIQRFFEDIRGGLTGTLTFAIEPADSQLSLDGRSLGAGYPKSLPVLRGLHVLKVTHPGYDPEEREVNVEIGASVAASIKLVPNARTIYFYVKPEGTELLLDGKLIGKAEKLASSQSEWARFLQDNGGDPGSVYVIPALYLPPGDHRVKLTRPCYLGKEFLLTVVLDKVNNAPGFIKPISLERRTITLEVRSHPEGSQVLVDGQSYGTTPLSVPDFCIGDHEVLIRKDGVGEYRATVTVPDLSPFKVEATLRPTLLWVGWTRTQDVTADQIQTAMGSFLPAFQSMKRFNATVAQEKNPLLPDTFFTPGVGEQNQASTVKELCEKYGCQGLLAGKISVESGQLTGTLRLFVPRLPGFDEVQQGLASASKAGAVLEPMDRPLFDVTPDQMLVLADFPGAPGPTFVRGLGGENGPRPSDVLLAVGSVPTPTADAARKAMAGVSSPALRFLDGGQEKTWILKADSLLSVVPYGGTAYGYRRQWLLARQEDMGAEGPRQRQFALMNVAAAALNLGLPAEALKALDGMDQPAPDGPDLSAVAYLKAAALLQLDRVEEARPLLLTAASDSSASLDGLGRILVQPLATDALRQLPPPPPEPPAAPAGSESK